MANDNKEIPKDDNTGCSVCVGISYFTQAMARSKSPPLCYGFNVHYERLPPPFKNNSDIEKAAEEQFDGNTQDLYFLIFGKSITTKNMQNKGIAPFCASGVAAAGVDTSSPVDRPIPNQKQNVFSPYLPTSLEEIKLHGERRLSQGIVYSA